MRDHTPEPTPPAAALAVPCRRCGTEGGYVPAGGHYPKRTKGYCDYCAKLLHERAAIHGYANREEADAALPHGEPQRHIVSPRAQAVRMMTATENAAARVEARQRAIRDHRGPHITTPTPTGLAGMPWPAAWGTPATDPLARAAWADEEASAA